MNIDKRLERLEQRQPDLPILMLTYGIPDDGRYHGPDNVTYTPEEFNELKIQYQIIVLAYVDDWRSDLDEPSIQMTWDDD